MRYVTPLLVLLLACDPGAGDPLDDEAAAAIGGKADGTALADGTPDADGVLALLNDPVNDFAFFDDDVRLDRRAAKNLVAHRDGPDGEPGTDDDDLFDDLVEVDAVKYVGPVALSRLLDAARLHGYVVDAATPLGIVSDIDKTLLPPHDHDEPLPAPYPGVSTLLKILEGDTPGDLTFVTARTAERAEGIDAWMADVGIPAGPIETGVSGIPWVAQAEKVRDISRVFDAAPTDQRFVLFGDSSHRDPEVYREIRETYGDRVIAGFIHKVNNPNPRRLEGLHLIHDYADAAERLLELGVLDVDEARRVMKAAQAEGLEIADEDIEARLAD